MATLGQSQQRSTKTTARSSTFKSSRPITRRARAPSPPLSFCFCAAPRGTYHILPRPPPSRRPQAMPELHTTFRSWCACVLFLKRRLTPLKRWSASTGSTSSSTRACRTGTPRGPSRSQSAPRRGPGHSAAMLHPGCCCAGASRAAVRARSHRFRHYLPSGSRPTQAEAADGIPVVDSFRSLSDVGAQQPTSPGPSTPGSSMREVSYATQSSGEGRGPEGGEAHRPRAKSRTQGCVPGFFSPQGNLFRGHAFPSSASGVELFAAAAAQQQPQVPAAASWSEADEDSAYDARACAAASSTSRPLRQLTGEESPVEGCAEGASAGPAPNPARMKPPRSSFVGRARDPKSGRVSRPRLFGGALGSVGMSRSIGAAAAAFLLPSAPFCPLQMRPAGRAFRRMK